MKDWEKNRLIIELSELLTTAVRTKGELPARDWERMEEARRKAHAVKHPEVLDD